MGIAVTVIIPAHNTSAGILNGLESLRRQTLPRDRFEVVYVDDGSDDGTGELLDAELADEPNFQVVHIENSGWPGRPRNIGIDRARGDYVFFMDDDDRLGDEALERLVARADEDAADIVIGRVAGIGRNAPREIFQKPMRGGDIRKDRLLLTTLTVQKLFRTAFLRDNKLRFDEGKVRLEDHMFMLRAYLATSRVSVVHDYTCYYWVRNQDFGNISFAPKEPVGFFRSIGHIFDIVEENVPPGKLRDRLYAHWYRSKLLGQYQGPKFLRQEAEHVRRLHALGADLVRSRIPEHVTAQLNPFTRLRATTLLNGTPELMTALAGFEQDMAHRTRVTGFRWEGTRLHVDVVVEPTRVSTGRPMEFLREDDRVYWDLPAELMAVPEIRAAAEIGDALGKADVRVFARRSGDPASLRVPVQVERAERPAGPGRFTLELPGTITVDTAAADHGNPLSGQWWFRTRFDLGGAGSDHTVGTARGADADRTRTPAFVDLGDRTSFVNPHWNGKGHLVIGVDGSWRPLRRALRAPAAARATPTPTGLRLEIPLVLRAAESGVEVPLRVARNGRPPLTVAARVNATREGSPSAPHAVLTATFPTPPGVGPWQLQVGGGEPCDLGVVLLRTPTGWLVTRPLQDRARRRLAPLVDQAREQARRLPAPARKAARQAWLRLKG
ncbi:glycosyltransferase family 2 protein [Nocardiopsis trehalosi]|uniref:glycosyltransferase family 2 protein n=1 Tax=Nocardiopsis trehalosi TaxID=109329 RepID=UPI0008371588|nr:glycosyltransferase family 2 protein [Nocardiopsis trehalosi]